MVKSSEMFLTLALIGFFCLSSVSQAFIMGHRPLSKRSFMDLQCKGVYDKEIFAKLDSVCVDCYNLYREPQLHQLCRKNCFSSKYFQECVNVTLRQLLNEEEGKYDEMIEILGKRSL